MGANNNGEEMTVRLGARGDWVLLVQARGARRRRLVVFVLSEPAWVFWICPVGCEPLDACGFA